MDILQKLIHELEVKGTRWFRIGAIALAVLFVGLAYNWRAFRNFNTQEGMDNAQLARNIAEGKGYTTSFVRPLSMYLLSKRNAGEPNASRLKISKPEDRKLIGTTNTVEFGHPDLANPPLYPALLSLAMRVPVFDYELSKSPKPFWTRDGRFYRYQPDFLISLLNQALFVGVVGMVFVIARRLFEPAVAWASAGIVMGTEIFWRFSMSGQSTILVLLLFLGLAYCLMDLDEEAREPRHGIAWPFLMAGLAGLLLGLLALTRYSMGWLAIPALGFVALYGGRQRWVLGALMLVVFTLCLGPWIARNVSLSGMPFGTATYALIENTGNYGDFRLQRSLNPSIAMPQLITLWSKLMENLRPVLTNELPRLGGSWVTAFFLVGLLIGYQNVTARRLRYWVLVSLGVMAVVQSLGRTELSAASPEINTENLIVLVTPLVIIFGVSLFLLLFDQLVLPFRELRYVVIGLFVLVACLPLALTFLPPRIQPVAYPPYFPPGIQTVCKWLKEDELAMSDVPWATAWYGNRQTVWLTLRVRQDLKEPEVNEDFFDVSDYQKPVNLLYLSPAFMRTGFSTEWIGTGEFGWQNLVLSSIVGKNVPQYFPLRASQPGWLPDQFVVTDSLLRMTQAADR